MHVPFNASIYNVRWYSRYLSDHVFVLYCKKYRNERNGVVSYTNIMQLLPSCC